VLCGVVAFAGSASAKLTPAQKLFTQKLLDSPQVAHSIKVTLKKGGFVSSDVMFADLTGEGKDDAVVTVDSGGSAGIIAVYILSAGSGSNLQVVYRNQRLYRASARINPGPALVYTSPQYKDTDELCCPSSYRETELKWSAKSKRFGVAQRRTVTAA
jgi:hypothetical protein